VPAVVESSGEGTVTLVLGAAFRAISPGQSGVMFDAQDRVIGGGVIAG
jgi:tRNA U34 2-thiouridine synthase MnmA/TrmU